MGDFNKPSVEVTKLIVTSSMDDSGTVGMCQSGPCTPQPGPEVRGGGAGDGGSKTFLRLREATQSRLPVCRAGVRVPSSHPVSNPGPCDSVGNKSPRFGGSYHRITE